MLPNQDTPQPGADSVCLYDAACEMIDAMNAVQRAKAVLEKAKQAYTESQAVFSKAWRDSYWSSDTSMVVEVEPTQHYVIQVSHEDGAIDRIFMVDEILATPITRQFSKPEGTHE